MKLLTKFSIVFAVLCFGLLLLAILELVHQHELMHSVHPNPQNEEQEDSEEYPFVDWDYWLAINPDIVGWISIPETEINYPVVHAPQSNPYYYLTHDVFGNWNYLGCIYLDAQCDESFASNLNAVLFGHNLGFGDSSMFATLTKYLDESYAKKHSKVFIQTPQEQYCYTIVGARILQGSEQTKRIEFDGSRDFEQWKNEQLQACQMSGITPSHQVGTMISLCTCSYFQQEDERTIVYALRDTSPSA